jgi:transcription initiation factor TFIID subunit 6
LKAYEYILTKAQTERGPNDEGLRLLIAGIMKGITSITSDSTPMTNGTNGIASDANESQMVEEYLGTIIGARVTALGDHKLNKAILDSREKH